MQRQVSYRFGRLNLTTVDQDKKDFLKRTLDSRVELETNTSLFGFFDVSEHEFEDETFFFGKLAKLKREVKTKVGDLSTHTLEDILIKDNMVAESNFLLHIKTGLIAYRVSEPHINNSNFRRYFSELVKKANDYFFVDAEIQSIREEFEVLEAIKTFPSIFLVDITLHPTNPSARPIYREVDERIQELEAESVRERIKAKNKNKGLRVRNDKRVIAKITMAEDGYGSARVDAIRPDGKEVTIRTKDKTVIAKVPIGETSGDSILSSLIGTFRRLWERSRK